MPNGTIYGVSFTDSLVAVSELFEMITRRELGITTHDAMMVAMDFIYAEQG